MRYVKYGLYVLGALVILAGLVFGYIAATFDPNAYKIDITRFVAEKTGRTLSIDGDLRLTFFPKVGVTLGGTRLSERGSEAEFAGVDDFRVALAFLPLLSGNVVVDEVVLDGLRANLIRHADGTINIDDLTSLDQMENGAATEQDRVKEGEAQDGRADQTQAAADTEEADERPPVKLDIEGVRIVNAAFTWTEEESGATYEISELSVQTGRIAEGVPTKFKYSAVIRADQPRLDLRTRASGTLIADVDKQVFKVDALKVNVDGDAATLIGLAVKIAADIEARSGTQWIGVNGLEVDASGSTGQDTFKTRLEVPNLVFNKGAVTVDNLAASLTGVMVGADVSGERGPDLRADANIRLTGITGSARALSIGELAIDLDAGQGDNGVKGRLTTPVKGNLEKQVFQLPKIAGQYRVRSPALPTKTTTIPLAGALGADLRRETVHADFKMRFDESSIEGVFDMKKFADQFFGFDVGIDRLDVDRYTASEQDSTKGQGAKGGSKDDTQKDTPFDLSPLNALKLAGELRIGTLIASGVKLSDVRINVKAAGGKLELNPLFAKLYGGSTRGIVTADANTNKFTVNQTLSSVAVGPLLRDSLDQDLLDGRGTVTLDLKSRGDTVSALTRTLTGGAGIALKDGAVKGINLAQSMRNAGDLLSLKRNRETAASATEKTDFSDLSASFVIAKGKAHNDDLSLRSPFIRLNGKGDIDIVESSLDYLANVSLVATSSGQDGKDVADVADVAGFTMPVRVSGPMTALKYKLQFSDAIADQSKQLIKAEQRKLEKKLESELMEKLLGDDAPGAPAEDSDAEPMAPSAKPEDELRRQLKKLLR